VLLRLRCSLERSFFLAYREEVLEWRHMKTALLLVCLAFIAPSGLYCQTPQASCPGATGAYLRIGANWKPIDESHSVGFKTTGVAASAFSYGAAPAKMKAQFRDPRSPYQLRNSKLEMCLVGVTDSGRDISLAKMQEEKDRRELPMAKYRLWTGINAQLDPKNLIAVDVQKLGDKLYYLTSKEAMPSGEFILFTIIPDVAAMARANNSSSLGGYDIGYHPN